MKLEDIFKAENLPPIYPMSSKEGQDRFVEGASITSGNYAIDVASGIGGFPTDRIIEIYGAESCGKTTVALQACAAFNKIGKKAVFIDVEHALDWTYATALKVIPDLFYVQQPVSAEEALKIALSASQSEDVGIFVLDSVAALSTEAELAGDIGQAHIAQVARLMSGNIKKIVAACSVNETFGIFINQERSNPGAYGALYTTGGRALKYAASMRIKLKKTDTNKDKEGVSTSNETEAYFVKNKLAPPFTTAKFDIIFGKGVDSNSAIAKHAVEVGVIEKKGSFFSYKGKQLAHGKEALAKVIKMDGTLRKEIKEAIKTKANEQTSKKAKSRRKKDNDGIQVDEEEGFTESTVPVV